MLVHSYPKNWTGLLLPVSWSVIRLRLTCWTPSAKQLEMHSTLLTAPGKLGFLLPEVKASSLIITRNGRYNNNERKKKENIGGLAVEHKRMEQWGKNKEGVLLNGEHRTGSRSVESLALLISRSRRHAELRPTKKGTTTNEKWEDSGWTRTYSPCTPPRTDGRSPFSCLARWRRRTTKNRTDTIHVYQPTTRHYRVINPDQPVKTPHSFQLGSTWSAQVLGGNAQVSYRLVLFIFWNFHSPAPMFFWRTKLTMGSVAM